MSDFPSWVYIVLVGAVAIVLGMLLPKKRAVKPQETALSSTVEKVEDTLEHYMTEIEKENEEIIDLVSKIKQESTAKQIALQEQVSEMRQRLMELEQRAVTVPQPVIVEKPAVETVTVPVTETIIIGRQGEALLESAVRLQQEQAALQAAELEQDAAKERIEDRYPELFQLHRNGKSVDAIARALSLHRGEVLLILQLAKQEEQS
ncbi:hypothetical protein [Paenibacillus campi]|uniref:hypothetical protein n=1 Tax=Paenibacillus campi TaxID=3106031 RepID=UPI002AFE40A6|nr:hypothetical protein [Paenibacillus sp. SGZ-1014]